MARRKAPPKNPAPENKDQQQPPEDKDDAQQPDEDQDEQQQDVPQDDDEQDDDPLLADYVEVKAHLDKLLMAEQRQYVGSIGRRQLHQIADSIRKQLKGETGEDSDE